MPITNTPLRYPGGKSKLYNYVRSLIQHNQLTNCVYVEPFVGGAGLALSLLFNNLVREIIINDFDYSVYAFWFCVLNRTDDFITAIKQLPVTTEEWLRQREIQKRKFEYDIFNVGLSTFFLNRTNRSGILDGGLIGGLEQNGPYKLNCRFNKENLISKIHTISLLANRIQLFNMDIRDFIPNIINVLPSDTFIYFDPPYIAQGGNLYCNHFKKRDHESLSQIIKTVQYPWILTYDKEPMVYSMYHGFRICELDLTYSAGTTRDGTELIVYSNQVIPIYLSKSDAVGSVISI